MDSASTSYTPSTITTYNFRAIYEGDTNYNSGTTGAASGTLTVKANPNVPVPTLNPVSPITLGGSVTALVTVTGSAGTPTGTVTFQVSTDSGTTWSTFGAVKTLTSGSATSDSYTPLAVSTNYRLRAVYSGDSTYVGVTGAAAALTVNKFTPTVPAPTVSPNPVVVSHAVTVSVTVPSVVGVTPTGTATFQVKIGAGSFTTIGSAVTLVNGVASTTYTPTTVDSYQFQVVYNGDGNYNSATSTATSLTVLGEFGYHTVGTRTNGNLENNIRGSSFTTPSSTNAVAQSISAYIIVSSNHTIKAAIYTASGSLVTGTSTSDVTVTTSNDGWVTFYFASGVTLNANTNYYLVVWSNSVSGTAFLYYDTIGGTGGFVSQTYISGSSWPSPVTFSSSGIATYNYSIYCTYTTP